jgi:hypothetical protein
MKLIDLLNKELNEMAAITNADAVVKLIKAGKHAEAVAEMHKEKQLKVVPGNVTSQITAAEKAAFSAALKGIAPSAQRGPSKKSAEAKIEKALDTKITSTQNQKSIKDRLLQVLIKTTKSVQSDPKLSDEDKKLNNEALEILKDALIYTRDHKKGLLVDVKSAAKERQSKIADKFLLKNAPEALAMAKEMESDYIEAEKAYIAKMGKEEGRDTTAEKDIERAFQSGLLKHITRVGTSGDDLDIRIGADKETIDKEIEADDKEGQNEFNREFNKKVGTASKEKIAQDKATEKKRTQDKLDQATKKGGTTKQLENLRKKAEGAAEVSKLATTDLIKDAWKKRKENK